MKISINVALCLIYNLISICENCYININENKLSMAIMASMANGAALANGSGNIQRESGASSAGSASRSSWRLNISTENMARNQCNVKWRLS